MNARSLRNAALSGLISAGFLGLIAAPAEAQKGTGRAQGIAQQAIKPEVVPLTGKLTEIRTGLCEDATRPSAVGTHLLVSTPDGKTLNVHLGPASEVARDVARLTVGDPITVQAFRTDGLKAGHYIARSVRSGETEFVLRDASLRPVWAGRGVIDTPAGPGPGPGQMNGRRGWGNGRGRGMGGGMGMGRGAGGNGGCCGMGPGGNGPGRGQGAAGAGGAPGAMGMSAAEHENVFALLSGHDAIARKVEEIPGGVKTTTTTTRPELLTALRAHVRQMALHLEEGRPVRMWDPVFRDLFRHHDEIDLSTQEIEGGIEVTETSENPNVVPLIRAHARKVDAFVAEGHAAARPPWAGGRGRMMRGR